MAATVSFDAGDNVILTVTAPAGTGTVAITASTNDNGNVGAGCPGALGFSDNGNTFKYTGGGGGGGGGGGSGSGSSGSSSSSSTPTTPTDSQNARALQTGVTKSVAGVSSQTVVNQIGGAIGDAFGGGGNPIPIGPGGVTIHFAAVPKSEVERRTDEAFSALAYNGSGRKPPERAGPYREWSAWLDLRGAGWHNHSANSGMNGNQANATGGIARKLTPDFLIGIYGGYDHSKYDVSVTNSEMRSNGGSIGTYMGWRIAPMLRFDASLGYGRISYSTKSGTATGTFDGNRVMASSNLTGSFGIERYRIEPSASVFALWERQTAWTDSLGTAQASRTFSAGRTSLGSKVIREFDCGSLLLAPYVGFYGDWRFSSDNATAGGTPVVGIGDGWSGRATTGVVLTARNRASLTIGGEYGGLGAAYKIWTGNIRANVPF
ncbi:MAG: autotransporter outer membrane beta-barrel domain-containing protein [Pseudolabrys sp.]